MEWEGGEGALGREKVKEAPGPAPLAARRSPVAALLPQPALGSSSHPPQPTFSLNIKKRRERVLYTFWTWKNILGKGNYCFIVNRDCQLHWVICS